MKINYNCMPCMVNQAVKVAEMTGAENREELFRKIFGYLSDIDFEKTNPEVIGEIFGIIKKHVGVDDPYGELKAHYNEMFLNMLDELSSKIDIADDPFRMAVVYAILGNIIDFNPVHNSSINNIMSMFDSANTASLTIDDVDTLKTDIKKCKKLLYIGDNCGEICLDMLFIQKIKQQYSGISVYFAVRGSAVVNDSTESDAYSVGMDKYASIISNGDSSMGTVIERVSDEFRSVYDSADVIISKGQANYESLSDEYDKNIYFLLVTKCEVIAKDIDVPVNSLLCMNK